MKPPKFSYHAPATLDEATAVLAEHAEDGKVLAGGQSLIPLLSFRLAAPGHLVDINRLPGLDRVERQAAAGGSPLSSGNALSNARWNCRPESRCYPRRYGTWPTPRSATAAPGGLAHGDSSAELPSVMVALDARMSVASARGVRQVGADDFFQFHLTTAIEPDELLLAVEFDEPRPRTYSAFREFALRQGDFCLAGVAVSATFGADGRVELCRIVAAGHGAHPAAAGRSRGGGDRL